MAAVVAAPAYRIPELLVQVLGITGTVCWILMLAPQAVKNFRKQSTEGLSLGMVIIWHVASVISTGYFAKDVDGNFFAILSFGSCGLFCSLIEAQEVAYKREARRQLLLWGLTTLLFATQVGASLAFYGLFSAMPDEAAYLIGNVLPSILLGAGFLPQIHEFTSSKSIGGYSFGVTLFDVVGCATNSAVLFAPASTSIADAAREAAPFLTIIVMHVVLVAVATAVVCRVPRVVKEAQVQTEDEDTEDAGSSGSSNSDSAPEANLGQDFFSI